MIELRKRMGPDSEIMRSGCLTLHLTALRNVCLKFRIIRYDIEKESLPFKLSPSSSNPTILDPHLYVIRF